MNILYISNLTGNLYAGPNNSVPAQIRAQSAYDNVFWYNLNSVKRPEWSDGTLDCKNLNDYPSGRLSDLPEPFNKPDIAVVEELYCHPFSKIIHDLYKLRIPYVIVPRSEMTYQAQQKKKWKKIIGNFLYFNGMIRDASAIQYLTEQEMNESDPRWHKKYFIVPNGIYKQDTVKAEFSGNGIRASYIGRFEIYQKGLDIMMEALAGEAELLRANGFRLNMYGPNQEGTLEKLNEQIERYGISDLITINESVFKEEKRKVLLETDVFIMTSRFEGLPMGMIEAFSYGLPCIATSGTNLSEEVKQYDAGWTAENNVDSVRNTLRDMVNSYHNLKEKSKNAIKLANVYSWDTIARKSHDEYVKLLNE